MNLALCIMVKNEEKFVERCILSVKDVVSNIYILDTGSTDNTVSISKKYTKNIFFKSFNGNFANMRQHLIDKVNEEWILFLDADEFFSEYDNKLLKELIEDIADDIGGIKFYRYNFFANGGWYTDHIVKLFRNNKLFKYDKKVTEKIENSILENNYKVLDVPIILNHRGHCKSRKFRDKKTVNYIKLLKEQLKITPNDALLHSYIGINSMNIGNFELAESETKLGYNMDSNSFVTASFYASVMRAKNKNKIAIDIYNDILKKNKESPMISMIQNMLGVNYFLLGDFENAMINFQKAYKNNEILIHILINIGLVYFFSGEYIDALHNFEKVVERNPTFLEEEMEGLLEYDPFRSCSYETIQNYVGLKYYISLCHQKIKCQSDLNNSRT